MLDVRLHTGYCTFWVILYGDMPGMFDYDWEPDTCYNLQIIL